MERPRAGNGELHNGIERRTHQRGSNKGGGGGTFDGGFRALCHEDEEEVVHLLHLLEVLDLIRLVEEALQRKQDR